MMACMHCESSKRGAAEHGAGAENGRLHEQRRRKKSARAHMHISHYDALQAFLRDGRVLDVFVGL